MNILSARQRARLYIYTKSKRNAKHFYIQKARHFSNSKKICVRFMYTKIQTLYITQFFIQFLKLAFIFKNNDTLRYVKFLYTKSQTLRKKKYNLGCVFIYKNADTLCDAIFHRIFKIGGGGRPFYICKKQCTLQINFHMQKTMHFSLRFYI